MFRKLIKYDLMASARTLLPAFAVFLGLSVLTILFNIISMETPRNIAIVLLVIMGMVIGVMYLVSILQHYNRSLYKQEGYLTHTLPVSTTKLLLSKTVSGLIWGAACILIFVIAALIVAIGSGELGTIMDGLSFFFREFKFEYLDESISIVCILVGSACYSLLILLLSCSISAIPFFRNRHLGVVAGILGFFATYGISFRIIVGILNLFENISFRPLFNTLTVFLAAAVFFAFAGLFFALCVYLTKRHKSI